MQTKSTKKALLMSVLSVLVCFTMLIGTTFAWFTDSVASTGNIIKSGNLDVTLEWMDGTEEVADADSDIWQDASQIAIFDYDLWEPGFTQVRHVKIGNEGTLALKYKVVIEANGETTDLADVIDVYYLDPAAQVKGREDLTDDDYLGTLSNVIGKINNAAAGELAADTDDVITIALKMQESAGNTYMNKSVGTTFSVKILATQLASEEDSFGKDYDETATHYDALATTQAEISAAVKAGKKTIGISGTVTLTGGMNISNTTFVGVGNGAAIDFGTHGISGIGNTFQNLTLDNDRNGYYNGMQYSDAENTTYKNCVIANGVTTYGNSTFVGCTFNELPAGNYALWFYDGVNFVVEDCVFNYGNRAIKIFSDGPLDMTVTIRNCSFKASETSVASKAMIEIDDTHMRSAKVTVSDITIDSAIAAQGVYRIDDGALNTSTAKSVVTVSGVKTLVSDGLCTDENGNYYVYTAAGLNSLKAWMDSNQNKAFWGKTYNIMADIDATNVSWPTKQYSPDSNTFNGIVFNGNGHTISNLTITGSGLFTGATKGMDSTQVSTFKDITFDNATVTGGTHHNGVVWGEAYGGLTLENVKVINSKVNGGCNVGGLVGRNSELHSVFTFTDCSVIDTVINATQVGDYAGASAFLGNALKIGDSCSAKVVFNGNNVSERNELNSASGLYGGGIYTVAEYGAETWEQPIVVTDFTNHN